MLSGIRQQAIVKPGGVIELVSPELPAGAVVEVIVLLQPSDNLESDPSPPLTSFIGAAPGNFASPEQADEFIRQERDAWDY